MIDIDIAGLIVTALVVLTPVYSMMYDMKKDMGDMKGNIAKLATIISLCPNCPHTDKREVTARREHGR